MRTRYLRVEADGRRRRRTGALVTFARHNLIRDPFPPLGQGRRPDPLPQLLHIYFDADTVGQILRSLSTQTRPRRARSSWGRRMCCLRARAGWPCPRPLGSPARARVRRPLRRPAAAVVPAEDRHDQAGYFLARIEELQSNDSGGGGELVAAGALCRAGLRARGVQARRRPRGARRRSGRAARVPAGAARRAEPQPATSRSWARSTSPTSPRPRGARRAGRGDRLSHGPDAAAPGPQSWLRQRAGRTQKLASSWSGRRPCAVGGDYARRRMRAVVYEDSSRCRRSRSVAGPGARAARRGGARRGDRAVPLGLARVDGPRPRHPPLPARARPRAGRRGRGGRRRRRALAARASA